MSQRPLIMGRSWLSFVLPITALRAHMYRPIHLMFEEVNTRSTVHGQQGEICWFTPPARRQRVKKKKVIGRSVALGYTACRFKPVSRGLVPWRRLSTPWHDRCDFSYKYSFSNFSFLREINFLEGSQGIGHGEQRKTACCEKKVVLYRLGSIGSLISSSVHQSRRVLHQNQCHFGLF